MLKNITFKSLLIIFILAPSIFFAQDILKEGELLLKEGQYIKSRDFFKKHIEVPNVADRALLGIGKSEYYLENYPEAILYLRKIIRDFRDSPLTNEANLYLGMSYLKQGKIKNAEFHLRKVAPPFEQRAKIGLGWICIYKGELKTAENILKNLNNKEVRENTDAALLQIKYFIHIGKSEQALREFERNPKLNKFEIIKAEILFKSNKFSEAEQLLKKIILKSNKLMDKIQAKNLLFEIYLSQGNLDEALKIAKEIQIHLPTDNLKIRIYAIHMSQKNYEEAFKLLTTLVDRDLKIKNMVDFVITMINNNSEKTSEYILKTYPFLNNDSILLIEWANFLIKENKIAEAKNLLRKAQSGPRKTETVIPLAQIFIKEGKLSEAKKIIEPFREKKPLATALYAQILFIEGDKINALNIIRKISGKIDNPDILEIFGDLEYSHGDRKKAIKFWTEAANKGMASSALKAADYFYLNKSLSLAADHYKKAIDLNLQDKESLMWAYYQYGKITKNKSYLEKVANSEGKLSTAAKELLERL